MNIFLRRGLYTALAFFIIFAVIFFGAAMGESAIPFGTVFKTFINNIFQTSFTVDRIDAGIVWQYRLPRAIVGASCGASLALCGVIMQSLLRNPLADPYILGISAGASTGAVCIVLLGLATYLDQFVLVALKAIYIPIDTLPKGIFSMPVGAFIGAILAFIFVTLLAMRAGHNTTAIILAGIAGAQLFNALTAFIVTKWADAEAARGIMFWLLGNLSGVRWPQVFIAVPPAIIGFISCMWFARTLDAFTFGAEAASSLGISVRKTYVVLICICALLTAIMVSLVGAIGFVGLVIPHVARFLVGIKHRALIPASVVIGAIFMVLSDVVSRTIISGQVLPIGVITALIGAPAFAFILMGKRWNS